MGLDSRDYVREPSRGGGFGGGRGFRAAAPGELWAIKYLLIANAAVFLLDAGTKGALNDWLALELSHEITQATRLLDGAGREVARLPAGTEVQLLGVQEGYAVVRLGDGVTGIVAREDLDLRYTNFLQVWRFVTYGFCHGGFGHILFNMYFLWMFGRLIEPILGSREFLWFYLAGILASGLCFLAVTAVDHTAVLVGASGGVMAVTIATAMTYPREQVLLFFVIPLEFRWLAVIYVLGDLSGFAQGEGSVAHAAHLGGAAFGFLYHRNGWRIAPGHWSGRWRWPRLRMPKLPNWQRRSKPPLRVHQPTREELSERVDRLLDKIREQGEGSLTDEERAFLNDASRQYRSR